MAANPFSTPAEPLLPKQVAFCAEYLIDAKPTAAAIRAGYAESSAAGTAIQLLNDSRIVDVIARGQAQRLARVNMQADTVIVELSALAFSRIDHYRVDNDGNVCLAEGAPQNAMAAVQSVDCTTIEKFDTKTGEATRTRNVKLKLWDKPGALKLMGKHANVAACFDKVEVTGKDGGPIAVERVIREVIHHPHENVDAVH